MIAFLRGKIIEKNNNYIIIDVNNIGYKVFISESFFNTLKLKEEKELYIYHRVKEDSSDLYGFRDIESLDLFELLLSVSGIGPKSALGVLNIADISDIKESIIQGNADLLTKVSGIGKRTAERLVLELKNKVGKMFGGGSGLSGVNGDEIDALMSLGYSLSNAREALNKVDKKINDSGERIKKALKNIGQ